MRLTLVRMLYNVTYDTLTAGNKLSTATGFAILFTGMSETNEVGLKAGEDVG